MDESVLWNLMAKKMAGEASEEELAELEAFLKVNPDMAYVFSVVDGIKSTSAIKEQFSEEENNLLNKKLAEIDESLLPQNLPVKIHRSVVRLPKRFWAAASLFFILACSFLYYFLSKPHAPQKIAAVAQPTRHAFVADAPTTITLQDGTKVWLNSGSTLNCAADFGKMDRQVKLSGEAYFEVTHNAQKPFIVQAGSFMKVKVLGTTFNVKAYPGDPYIETSLITGKVTIDLNNGKRAPIILKPHEKVTFYLKDSSAAKPVPAQKIKTLVDYHIHSIKLNPVDQHISELSWMKGQLAFNDIPFAELAYDLERVYHIPIEFKDEKLKEYHLTGVFKGENLNEVLEALQVTTPFRYEISDKKVLIYN